MSRQTNLNFGRDRIEIEIHNNGAISIGNQNGRESYSYEEKADGSHKDQVKQHLETMASEAVAETKQIGIDFIDNDEIQP